MDNKELLYEISLKYNTLQMYNNTIEHMKSGGVASAEAIKKVENERDIVSEELEELISPNMSTDVTTNVKSPKLGSNKSENKFVKEVTKVNKNKDLYYIKNNFFDNILKPVKDDSPIKYRDESKDVIKTPEFKKPIYANIQDKISNTNWVYSYNFLMKFPKNEIDIDELYVTNFYYHSKQYVSCSSQKSSVCGGELEVTVKDFIEKRDDGSYNILMDIISRLESNSNAHVVGDIYVKVVNNGGAELYTMCFRKCRFIYSDGDGFSYETTGIRKVRLVFAYDKLSILEPDETAN